MDGRSCDYFSNIRSPSFARYEDDLEVGKGKIDTSEWIVTSEKQLIEVAKKIADVDYLTNCRKNLRKKLEQSPLGDAKRFAKNFTKAMRFAWTHKAEKQSAAAAKEAA